MIYYFSATGNSRYVAQQVAATTGDMCEEITNNASPAALFCPNGKEIKNDTLNGCENAQRIHTSSTGSEERQACAKNNVFGLVVPTHCWGLPALVREWIERIDFRIPADTYCFLIATYGTTTGQIALQTDRLLRQHAQHALDASFGVRMPDIYTPIFDLTDKEKVARRVAQAKDETVAVALRIRQRTCGCHIPRPIPAPIARIGYTFYESMRQTQHLHASEACIGCGLCAKQCPVQAIQMAEKRPQWTEKQCTMCLRCLHHCPKFAIQYDHRTDKHGQYTFKQYDKLCQ